MGVYIEEVDTTRSGIKFYEMYKSTFGEVKKATMLKDKDGWKLVLENVDKYHLKFDSSFTSGYHGEGCRGTVTILQMAGFNNIDLDFVANNKTFELLK